MITRAINIPIRFSTNDILLLKFYVTKLDSTCAFVFGHDWLHRYNPSIDWSAGQITHFRNPLHSVPSSAPAGSPGTEVPPTARFTSASSSKASVSSDTSDFDSFASEKASTTTPFPSVSFINAAAYARLARVSGNTLFTVTISNSDSVSGNAASATPVDLSGIPEDYHEYADVFSKSSASTLPPHRPYDLKIELEEGASPPIGRMYSLSETEMVALREFLDENLNNGFV